MASYGHTFTSGDTVTPTKLNNARTVSDIVNADINASAAIAGTKIAPNFGSQTIVTTGAIGAGTSSITSGYVLDGRGWIRAQHPAGDAVVAVVAGNTTGVSQVNFGDQDAEDIGAITYAHNLNAFQFRTNNVERVRINSSGNVGIGKSNPATILDVNGTVTATAFAGPLTGNVTGNLTGTASAVADGAVTPAKLSQPYTLATAQASTSGTSIDFTGIPSWAKRITVMFAGVSTNGTSEWLVVLGDSGGVEGTGYVSSVSTGSTVVSSTSGFVVLRGVAAATTNHGLVTICLVNPTNNTWVASGVLGWSNDTTTAVSGGSKSLSATLDRVRITTVNGIDTFDAGTINISYEG